MTQWAYDSADRLTWQKYPGGNGSQIGEQVNFTPDAQGLLRQVRSNGSTYYVGETLYNALGQVTERRLGSTTGVVKQLYTYTAAENFRLVTLQAGVSPTYANLQNISYGYDDVGNVLTITDAAAYDGDATPATQTQTFTYDPLHRLKTAQASGVPPNYGAYSQKNYDCDAIGNLTHFEGTTQNRYYLDAAHKHALTHVGGTTAGYQKYWYDANGNATKRITDAPYDLIYDAENRLTQLKKNGAVSGTYVYDGDGVRVKETAGGVTRVFIGAYFEWTGSTTTMKRYYYAGGTRVAMRTGSSTLNYLLSDHLGSQALTLTNAGARFNPNTELRYMPYGVARYTAGATPTTFNFTGQRKDSGSGLLFYNARWYDPVVGRFLSPDTIVPSPGDPQSLNRYAYVLNNPVKYRDPSGHIPVDWLLDIGGIAFDIYQIIREPSRENWQALAVDVGLWALPYTPAVAGSALRSGKTAAAQLAAHADEMMDAARLVNRAADTAAGLRRFSSAGTEIVPDVLNAFGDGGRVAGDIPAAFKERGTRVIGRWWDTKVAEEFGGRIFKPAPELTDWDSIAKANYAWIQEAMKNGEVFYLASPVDLAHLSSKEYGVAIFARELDALLQAGYRRVGDYLIPPH